MNKTVERVCRGCKLLKNRNDMIKITLTKGELYINPDTKTVGRSVYVCKKDECIKNFIKSKSIKKGLRFNNDNKIKEVEQNLLKFIESN